MGAYSTLGNDEKSETIAIQGSTTVSSYMLKVQEVYEKEYNVKLQITSNGSGTGSMLYGSINRLVEYCSDIAESSIDLAMEND